MTFKPIAATLLIASAVGVFTTPALAQAEKSKVSREVALQKCIAIMTQYVTFDNKAEAAEAFGHDSATASRRYRNLYNNCMRDHGQTP